ncbi:sulfite exporter TauE/SafE family protein [Halohasta salina]|uniref:sulfite exporter TauE/SafE family protein n=1 Tax=Halohasta salina TaxID=2961621 RepID=UPI0020A46D59|nr:sulfite exporter TauE/SafE family protein [Halohasta salina]
MTVLLSVEFLGLFALIVVVSGAVNGLSGFGFAVVGTMALATVVDPAMAVVLMIIPMVAANAMLVGELSADELRTCGRRFGPLVASALVGTVVGMIVLDALPDRPLRIGLGLITLGFVASQQRAVLLPHIGTGGSTLDGRPAQIAVGSVSGVLFGATNVGVQLVAYLRSRDLSHGLFVGVVALVFLGINVLRVGAAGVLDLYPSLTVVGISVLASVPAVGGVAIGSRLRSRVTTPVRRRVVLGLLTVIGLRLVLGGLGIA